MAGQHHLALIHCWHLRSSKPNYNDQLSAGKMFPLCSDKLNCLLITVNCLLFFSIVLLILCIISGISGHIFCIHPHCGSDVLFIFFFCVQCWSLDTFSSCPVKFHLFICWIKTGLQSFSTLIRQAALWIIFQGVMEECICPLQGGRLPAL